MRGLTNKRTAITGGASGIGKATAMRFLEEGAQVVVVDRDAEALEQLQQEVPGVSGVFQADVSDHAAVEGVFEEITQKWGGLDILINNAGISLRHPFNEITPKEWRRVIDVNLSESPYG
jgi:meso-butanediol dehydrogenase/(S,S)-butanediol dehydrogenase/diacetyl reductase